MNKYKILDILKKKKKKRLRVHPTFPLEISEGFGRNSFW